MTKEELEYEKQLGLKDMEIKNKEVRITELEAQIEKAKNQWNCENNNGYCVSSICPCDKWKLRR